jgi:hypothetical protein
MATFKPKAFFKKIYAYPLITELYKRHDIIALFELTEQSSRKTVTNVLKDFYDSLSPEHKIEIDKELATIATLATVHGEYLFPLVLKKRSVSSVTTTDCTSKEDTALYYHLFHKDDIFDDVSFLHSFFVKPSYMLYETKDIDLKEAEFNITELTKEYKRILDKESLGKEYETSHTTLANTLYYSLKAKEIGSKKEEFLRVVYIKDTNEALISFNGSKYDKIILLDTFLRVICNDGYLEREESYDMSNFKKDSFDFSSHKNGTPLMSWKIKGVTLTLGGDKAKKIVKLNLPTQQESSGLHPLFSFYKELDIEKTAELAHLTSASFSLYFMNEKNKEKSIHVPITLREKGSNLCPLYPYHSYARKILKESGMYRGFVDIVKKEKEQVNKKWEA